MRTDILSKEREYFSSVASLKQEYAKLGEREISSVQECWESWFKPKTSAEFSEIDAQYSGGTVPEINMILVPRESALYFQAC